MKYFKAGLIRRQRCNRIGRNFVPRGDRAAGAGPDSSETVARPRKKNPPPDAATDPANTDSTDTDAGQRRATRQCRANFQCILAMTTSQRLTSQRSLPSSARRTRNFPRDTPTFSSDVNTVELDVAVLDNKGHFIPNIPKTSSACWKTTSRKRSRASTSMAMRR